MVHLVQLQLCLHVLVVKKWEVSEKSTLIDNHGGNYFSISQKKTCHYVEGSKMALCKIRSVHVYTFIDWSSDLQPPLSSFPWSIISFWRTFAFVDLSFMSIISSSVIFNMLINQSTTSWLFNFFSYSFKNSIVLFIF